MSNNVRVIKIEKDPDIERLANEARRLSMGGAHLYSLSSNPSGGDSRRGSSTIDNPGNTRRGSEKSFNIPITRVNKDSVSPRMSRASSGGSGSGGYVSERYGGGGGSSYGGNGGHVFSSSGVGRRQSEQFKHEKGCNVSSNHGGSNSNVSSGGVGRRQSEQFQHEKGCNGGNSYGRASPLPSSRISNSQRPPSFSRKQSEYLESSGRRGSYADPTHSSIAKREPSLTRRGSAAGFERRDSDSKYASLPRQSRRGSSAGMSGTDSLPRRGSNATRDWRASPGSRRNSEDVDAEEMKRRRLSEAGLRRPSATDIVLNENTDNLMVGQEIWVDGNKRGRIAFIGNVHFAKGEMAGVHFDAPIGKNNGTIGGILYFQTEPKHGLFSRLHRLAFAPLPEPEYDDDQGSY